MPYRTPLNQTAATGLEPATLEAAPAPAEAAPAEDELAPPPPPTASEGVHPLAVSPEEGLAAIPQEQLLKALLKLASLKAGAVLMYHTFADALRTPARDGLAAHFEEHAAEERAGLYDYNMKVIALGGSVSTKATRAPDAAGIQEILTAVIQFEKQQPEAQRKLIAASGEYAGLRLLLEENLLKDQRHLDDARRMLTTLP